MIVPRRRGGLAGLFAADAMPYRSARNTEGGSAAPSYTNRELVRRKLAKRPSIYKPGISMLVIASPPDTLPGIERFVRSYDIRIAIQN